MTMQERRRAQGAAATSSFAPLRPLLAGHQQDPGEGFHKLAEALRNYDSTVRIHIRLLRDDDVEHWEVHGGSAAAARRHEPQDADVIVVVRSETWLQIAQGQLAPYDALYAGKLRVGGNQEMAKRITQFLSDPAVPYVPPC